MLTLNLRLLERDGLIQRRALSEYNHVEYALSPVGEELSTQLMTLIDWAHNHSDYITRARAAFDAEHARSDREDEQACYPPGRCSPLRSAR